MHNVDRPRGIVDAVIDTDAYNEIDDQFAVSYLLCAGDRVNLRALYAAPFLNEKSTSPADGMEKSYREIHNLLRLAGREELCAVTYRGAERYLPDERTPVMSDAVRDLIGRARAYTPENPLYVLAIGAITNVASAFLAAPEIARSTVVVWLGGHAFHYPHNREFNCQQDVAAVRVVFNSGTQLVQLPCGGVVDALRTTEPELRAWLGGKSALCDYLVAHTVEEAEGYAKGKPWSRVIWDISVVAWLLDAEEEAVRSRAERRPIAQYDHHYSFSPDRPLMEYVYQIDRDRVFEDLFRRLAAGR